MVGLEAADSVVEEMEAATEADWEAVARGDDEMHTRPTRTCP